MDYTNKQIREFLTEFFAAEPEEFEFFCDDYYAAIKEQFAEGMSAKKRAHLLTTHVVDSGGIELLLSNLKAYDPAIFAEKAALLANPSADAPPTPSPAAAPTGSPMEPAAAPAGQDVFISYSRRDEAFIKELYRDLTGRGISTWYDRENISVATHWPTKIVEGIKNCKVFVLSLSPDAAASENVRKEVDLAQRYHKQIVPLIWRTTEIPIAMEYQLTGIQWIEFNENATPEKFRQLAEVLRRLLGGATMPEAVANTAIAAKSTLPAAPEIAPVSQSQSLLQLEREQTVSSTAVGGAVISGVVTTLGLKSQSQDALNGDLKWLFSAAGHFLRVQQNPALRSTPLGAQLPGLPNTNAALLASVDDFDLQIWRGQVEGALKRIQIHLRNLDILLAQEAKMGDAGKGEVYLQNQIKGGRLEIVKILRELAEVMKQAYGVSIDSPNQLLQILQG